MPPVSSNPECVNRRPAEGIYGTENLVKERERGFDLHNLSLGRSPKIANIDTTFDCLLPDMLP